MGVAGNRFGNTGGGSVLDDLDGRDFRRRVRTALLARLNRGGGGDIAPGPTAGRFGMMSSAPASAQDGTVHNERLRDKAIYGSYGRGGLERDRIAGRSLSEMAKRNMTQKDRAEIELKRNEHALRKRGLWNRKTDDFGDGATGAGTTSATGTGRSLGGERIGGLPTQPPETPGPVAPSPGPALRNAAPSMQVPPRSATEALGRSPEALDMTNMPQGGGMITRVNPDGGTEYFWTSPEGGTGRDSGASGSVPALADIVPPWGKDPWGLPIKNKTRGAGLKKKAGGAGLKKKAVGAGLKKKAGGKALTVAQTVAEVLKDMFYRAPAKAIGQNNLSAAGNTLADMAFRAPLRATGEGAEWLSRQVLGGLR